MILSITVFQRSSSIEGIYFKPSYIIILSNSDYYIKFLLDKVQYNSVSTLIYYKINLKKERMELSKHTNE